MLWSSFDGNGFRFLCVDLQVGDNVSIMMFPIKHMFDLKIIHAYVSYLIVLSQNHKDDLIKLLFRHGLYSLCVFLASLSGYLNTSLQSTLIIFRHELSLIF